MDLFSGWNKEPPKKEVVPRSASLNKPSSSTTTATPAAASTTAARKSPTPTSARRALGDPAKPANKNLAPAKPIPPRRSSTVHHELHTKQLQAKQAGAAATNKPAVAAAAAKPKVMPQRTASLKTADSASVASTLTSNTSETAPIAPPKLISAPTMVEEKPKTKSSNEDFGLTEVFEELMDTLGYDGPKRETMRKLSDEIKWKLIQQHKLQQKEQDQLKKENPDDDTGTPEFFVRILTRYEPTMVPLQAFQSLYVSLYSHPIEWVQKFLDLKGLIAVCKALAKINKNKSRSGVDLDIEMELVRCIKTLLNNRVGAQSAMNNPECITIVVGSIDSPKLLTRKLVAEVLTFLCYLEYPTGHVAVLKAFDEFAEDRGSDQRFGPWLHSLEQTIDGRGVWGSMVHASMEFKEIGGDTDLIDYVFSNTILVNALLGVCEELEPRIFLRTQLHSAGYSRLMTKMSEFSTDFIENQLEKFSHEEEADIEELSELHNQHEGVLKMTDPREIFDVLLKGVENTKAFDPFVHVLQRFLLIRDDSTRPRSYQLIEGLVNLVVMDRRNVAKDFKNTEGLSINAIFEKFKTQEELTDVKEDLENARQMIKRLSKDKTRLTYSNEEAKDLAKELQEKIAELQGKLEAEKSIQLQLGIRIAELSEKYESAIAEHEAQIAKLRETPPAVTTPAVTTTSVTATSVTTTSAVTTSDATTSDVITTSDAITTSDTNDADKVTLGSIPPPSLTGSTDQPPPKAGRGRGRGAPPPPAPPLPGSDDFESTPPPPRIGRGRGRGAPPPPAPPLPGSDFSNYVSPSEAEKFESSPVEALPPPPPPAAAGRGRGRGRGAPPPPPPGSEVYEEPAVEAPPIVAPPPAAGRGRGRGAPPPPPPGSEVYEEPAVAPPPPAAGRGRGRGGPPPPPGGHGTSDLSMPLTGAPVGRGRGGGPPPPPGAAGRGGPPPPPGRGRGGPVGPAARFGGKKVVKFMAKSKVKQAQIDKLADHLAAKTFWASNVEDREKIEDDFGNVLSEKKIFDNLEEMFSAKVIEVSDDKKKKEEDAEVKEVSVLNPKRAYNINIVLGRLRQYSLEDLRFAVLSCNTELLQEALLRQFIALVPTAEEKGLLSTLDLTQHIAKPDLFMLEMLKIERYEARLRCIHFSITFDERYSDLNRDVNAVMDASMTLQHCEKFPKILELILVLSNFMNGTSFRGNAKAFKIKSINKLMDTKTSDNQSTLLHFLASTVESLFPELLAFQDELKHVTAASRVSFGELASEMMEIQRQLKEIKDEFTHNFADITSISPKDKFVEIMKPKMEKNYKLFSDLNDRYEEMKKHFEEVVLMYGEELKGASPEDFFGIFKIFMTSFDKVLKDNQKIREKEKKAQERKIKEEQEKERKEARERQKKEQEEHKAKAQGKASEEDKGMMDKLLESLRSGKELESAPVRRPARRGLLDPSEAETGAAAGGAGKKGIGRRTYLSSRTMELLEHIKTSDPVARPSSRLNSPMISPTSGEAPPPPPPISLTAAAMMVTGEETTDEKGPPNGTIPSIQVQTTTTTTTE